MASDLGDEGELTAATIMPTKPPNIQPSAASLLGILSFVSGLINPTNPKTKMMKKARKLRIAMVSITPPSCVGSIVVLPSFRA